MGPGEASEHFQLLHMQLESCIPISFRVISTQCLGLDGFVSGHN